MTSRRHAALPSPWPLVLSVPTSSRRPPNAAQAHEMPWGTFKLATPIVEKLQAKQLAELRRMLLTMHGFAAVEPRRKAVARALGLNGRETSIEISLPSAAPDIRAGLRLDLTVPLILAVVCEMIAEFDGLGQVKVALRTRHASVLAPPMRAISLAPLAKVTPFQ